MELGCQVYTKSDALAQSCALLNITDQIILRIGNLDV